MLDIIKYSLINLGSIKIIKPFEKRGCEVMGQAGISISGNESRRRTLAIFVVAIMIMMVAAPMVSVAQAPTEAPVADIPEPGVDIPPINTVWAPDLTDFEPEKPSQSTAYPPNGEPVGGRESRPNAQGRPTQAYKPAGRQHPYGSQGGKPGDLMETFTPTQYSLSSLPPDPTPFNADIWVNPASLSPSVVTGQSAMETLTIGNSGTTDLTFNTLTSLLVSSGSTDPLPPDPTGFLADHDLNTDNWNDGGNDAFDGYARVDVTVGGVAQASLDITTGSREYTTNGYTYRMTSDWAENHILRYRIEPVTAGPRNDITVRLYGNLGSDGGTQSWMQTLDHNGAMINYFVTNDGSGLDGLDGDPQVTHWMIPADLTDLGAVSYSIGGDQSDIQAVDVSLPVTIYVTASYHPHAAIANWVNNDLLTSSPFVTVVPSDGTVPSMAQQDLTVTFDASNLNPGIYTGNVYITHNDPNQTRVAVPFTLTVLADTHDNRVLGMTAPELTRWSTRASTSRT